MVAAMVAVDKYMLLNTYKGSSMARYVIINSNNVVVNVILWDAVGWVYPRNYLVVVSDTARMGDIYDPMNQEFKNP